MSFMSNRVWFGPPSDDHKAPSAESLASMTEITAYLGQVTIPKMTFDYAQEPEPPPFSEGVTEAWLVDSRLVDEPVPVVIVADEDGNGFIAPRS